MHSDADWVVDDSPIGQVRGLSFHLFSSQVSQITVVAELFQHSAYTTNRTFGLDDGTARIEAKMWIDTPDDQLDQTWRGLQTTKYVSFFAECNELMERTEEVYSPLMSVLRAASRRTITKGTFTQATYVSLRTRMKCISTFWKRFP